MSASLGHERQLTFFPTNGHNHNGQNSSPVELVPGQVELGHLNDSVLDYIRGGGTGDETTNQPEGQLIPIPDLEFETNAIGPGASATGSIEWVGMGVVRFTRIMMSAETECTITFYHSGTYAEQDREFRALRCSNRFMWEGPWVHWDEDDSNKIHYRIENTGTATARFNVTLKAGTLIANSFANFVSSIHKLGSELDPFIGPVLLQEGNGIRITPDSSSNSFKIDAVAPEAITIDRYGLSPKKPVSYTSSTSTTVNGSGLNGGGQLGSYVNFGTGPQYVAMDFGAVYSVGRIVCQPYADGREWYDVRIDISTDNSNWQTLLSQQPVSNGTIHGVVVETPLGHPVRYVRFWSNGSSSNTSNHLNGAWIYAISDKVGT